MACLACFMVKSFLRGGSGYNDHLWANNVSIPDSILSAIVSTCLPMVLSLPIVSSISVARRVIAFCAVCKVSNAVLYCALEMFAFLLGVILTSS